MAKPCKPKIRELEYVPVPPAPEPFEQLVALVASLVDFVPTLCMSGKKQQKRVAIYARVSMHDMQDVMNQLRELRQWVRRMGYKVLREYVDNESGSKGRAERKQFAQMFQDASHRKFDLVLFWALDRFTREGLQKTIYYLQQPNEGRPLSFALAHNYTNPFHAATTIAYAIPATYNGQRVVSKFTPRRCTWQKMEGR